MINQPAPDLLYNQLFTRGIFVCEDNRPYFQEKLLQVIWNEQIFKSSTSTEDGRPLRITHSGTWNLESGPDFHDAVIVCDQHILRGDIEVHFRPADWTRHKHHKNIDYQSVILHVIWDNPADHKEFPAGVPLFNISKHLSRPLERVISEFDLMTYPYARQVPPGKYAALLSQINNKRLIDLFQCYGVARILRKAQLIASEIEKYGIEQATYKALFNAMGYKNNRKAFAVLADEISLQDLSSYPQTTALAVLYGAAGLLPDPTQVQVHPNYRQWVEDMWSRWWSKRKEYRVLDWKRDQMRPFNSPERRILAGYLILKKNHCKLGNSIIRTLWRNEQPKNCLRELEELFRLETETDLGVFHTFINTLSKPVSLVGKNRIRDMIVNFGLPLFLAHCFFKNDPVQCEKAKQVLLKIPRLQDNRLLKEASHYFFVPPSRRRDILINACTQQGMIKLYTDFKR